MTHKVLLTTPRFFAFEAMIREHLAERRVRGARAPCARHADEGGDAAHPGAGGRGADHRARAGDGPGARRGAAPAGDLLRTADFVSLHCPLTPATCGLMNEWTFGLMKPGAYLINTGRGPVVEEEALVQALRSRQIAGAARTRLSSG